jgi:hypothetical protein
MLKPTRNLRPLVVALVAVALVRVVVTTVATRARRRYRIWLNTGSFGSVMRHELDEDSGKDSIVVEDRALEVDDDDD